MPRSPRARSVGDLLRATASETGSAPAARWVFSRAAGPAARDLLARPDQGVPAPVIRAVAGILSRLQAGEPLQYVLGTWAFRRLDEIRVDPRVLIPRPETEQVVGYALEELGRAWTAEADGGAPPPGAPGAPGEPAALVGADLGTGSGVIALSLASESRPGFLPLEVWATDASDDALDVARTNLARLGQTDPAAAARVRIARGDWFDALPPSLAGRIQLIVANPPYVSAGDWPQLPPVVRDHEPRDALVAGANGLEALVLLVRGAPRWLAPGGSLVLELAPPQAGEVASEARRVGLVDVEVRPDLAGLARALVARRPRARRPRARRPRAGTVAPSAASSLRDRRTGTTGSRA